MTGFAGHEALPCEEMDSILNIQPETWLRDAFRNTKHNDCL